MPASDTEIRNMAVSHLGSGLDLGSGTLDSDSEAFKAIGLFFPFARNELLRRHQWQWATVYATLELLEECPNELFQFAYQYPKDALFFRKVQSSVRNDSQKTRVTFERGKIKDKDGVNTHAIFSDKEDAIGIYTERMDNAGDWPDDFAIALSYRLAYFAAARVTGGDPFKLQQAALNNFINEFNNAVRQDMREKQTDRPPLSPYIEARVGRGRTLTKEGFRLFPDNTVISP